jgi:hypothetical protein
VLARELGYAEKSLPESGAEQARGTRLMLRTGSSLTGTSAQRQASSTRVQSVEAGASTIGIGGRIIDREERKYPEMPEQKEQEDLRMPAEDPWADGTEIDSGWTEGTDDE